MILALVLLIAGVALSAFFSGAETGFYRVNRMRLVVDALAGDFISRGLLFLTNHASMFVATVLVGNNIANYFTSLGVVLGAQALLGREDHLPEILAPVVLAPLLFVYGELLPKYVFYHAPYRLLRAEGILLMASSFLFLPITGLLWLLSKGLEWIGGQSLQQVQLALARAELQQVFDEGHEAGILGPAQRELAQGIFAVASQPAGNFVIPAGRMAKVPEDMSKAEIRRLARRQRLAEVPVERRDGKRELVGYVRVVDLYLDQADAPLSIRPLVPIRESETHLAALTRLEQSQESMGQVIDAHGRTVGFVTIRQLAEPLFRGPKP